MIEIITSQDRFNRLKRAGISESTAETWCQSLADTKFGGSTEGATPLAAPAEDLDGDAARIRPLFEQGWDLVNSLPRRPRRNEDEKAAAQAMVHGMAQLCDKFTRAHRRTLYARLTGNLTRVIRLDDLVFQCAENWPGLLPSRSDLERESQRMQNEKDGLEINQGVFVSAIMGDADCGRHLLLSMLHPTDEARALLDEFVETGFADLGTVHVAMEGNTGYVYFNHPKTLNAEDDETQLPSEIAVDLILLHPRARMGVLRGNPVTHPKYNGRRVFNSGINLTRIYQGKQSYLFYLMRDLGMVSKIYRGLATQEAFTTETESTHEIPWIAVIDTHAIGGGCQLLLVVDYVIAESGSFFSLPARKEGIIPGCANMRLPRFMGERMARQAIMFDKTFYVDSPEARTLVNEVHPREDMDAAVQAAVDNAIGSGMVSAAGNRKAIRVETEPLDKMRQYIAAYASEQAFCHLSEQLTHNLERYWNARSRDIETD